MRVPGRRRAWVAAGLALLYPGLGHLYLRRWGRSVLWFGLLASATFLILPEVAVGPDPTVGSVVDGARAAWASTPARERAVLAAMQSVQALDAFLLGVGGPTRREETCPSCGEELDDEVSFCPWCAESLE
jgi:hypothetical protein